MRAQKSFFLVLILVIFLARFSCGIETDQVPGNKHSSIFSQRSTEILKSLQTRKIKIGSVHAVSHRLVPSGPNPLHNQFVRKKPVPCLFFFASQYGHYKEGIFFYFFIFSCRMMYFLLSKVRDQETLNFVISHNCHQLQSLIPGNNIVLETYSYFILSCIFIRIRSMI